MKKIILILTLTMLVLSGCGKTKGIKQDNVQNIQDGGKINLTQITDITFTKESFPKTDGSTATIPLSEGIVSKLLGMTPEEATKFVKHTKTHNAYVNLLEGKTDIIFVTEPSSDELQLAKEKNIELEVVPVVKDAFVFLLNTKNPVNSLTTRQIQDIYQGKIKNWNEVGGENGEIIAYQRPTNSGSQTIMENMVMKGLKLAEAPKELTPAEMGELVESVAGYDNSDRAIGYSVYYYAKTMYSKNTIKLIGVDGVYPDKDTIMANKYPFSSAYYAVIRKTEPQDSPARNLLKWVLSGEGQKVAEASGYVPLR